METSKVWVKRLLMRYMCYAWNCAETQGLRYFHVFPGDNAPFCKAHAVDLLAANSEVTVMDGEPDDGEMIEFGAVEETRPEQEVATETQEAAESLAMAKEFQILSQADLDFSAQILVDVKTRAKKLDALKKKITEPLNESLKQVRNLFRPAEECLASIEAEVKTKVAAYNTAMLNAQRKAIAKATSDDATAEEVQAALVQRAETEVAAPSGVAMREVLKFEVLDPDKVPRALCSPDMAKIRAMVALGENANIPGVRIYRDTQVSVRTGPVRTKT